MVGRTIAHYRVIAEVGGGGTGVVYRARDLKLDRLVALKLLAPDPGGRASSRDAARAERAARFKEAAKTASAINHPNICTIYAIDETADGRLYMVMAWYEGETLETKIRRGPLPAAEVVAYGAQIAAGLAAAHARGIVHRNVKPANLMVTHAGVVKVLDFGLAELVGGASDRVPEQVAEETVDERSDVWALGVVLYGMATGERPLRGAGLSVRRDGDGRDPVFSPRALEIAPPALRGIIEKALATDRAQRYRSAAELFIDLDALRERGTGADGGRPETLAGRARRSVWPSIAVAAALALTLGLGWALSDRAPIDGMARHMPAVAIALGFMDRSAPADGWICDAVEELVIFAVPETMRLRWRRPDDATIQAFQTPGGYADASGLQASVLARLRAAEPAASGVLTGSCRGSAENVDVEVRVQDLHTGATLGLWPASGGHDDAIALAAALAAEVAAALGVEARRDGPPLPPLAAHGAELLAEARVALRRHDPRAAYEAVTRARAVAPDAPQVLIAGADALLALGRVREAQSAAAEALRAARDAPLRLQAGYRVRALEARGQRDRAAALEQALWRSASVLARDAEAVDRALHLGWLLAEVGDRRSVAEVLARLRAAGVADPRMVLVEALAARQLAQNREQIEALRQGLDPALRERQPLLWARARHLEVQPLRRLGLRVEALAAAREARAIFEAEGLDIGVADAWMEQGNVEWDRQDLRAAGESFDKAASLYRALGNDRKISRALHNQALVREELGDVEVASQLYEQAGALLHTLGDPVAEVFVLTNHANLLIRTGRFHAADAALARAGQIDATVASVDTHAWYRSSLGGFLRWRGRLAAADRLLAQALALAGPAGDRLQIADAAEHRGYLLLDRGDPAAAIAAFAMARQQYEASGDRGVFLAGALRGEGLAQLAAGRLAAARASLDRARALLDTRAQPYPGELESALAALALAEGDPAAAARLAGAAIEVLGARGEVLAMAEAQHGLAEALLASGRPRQAAATVRRARALLADVDAPVILVPLALTAARCALAEGELEKARGELRWAHGTAVRLGLGRYQLEARRIEAEAVSS